MRSLRYSTQLAFPTGTNMNSARGHVARATREKSGPVGWARPSNCASTSDFFEQLSSYLGRECRRPGRAGDAQELLEGPFHRSRLYLPVRSSRSLAAAKVAIRPKRPRGSLRSTSGRRIPIARQKTPERSLRPAGWTRPIWPLLLATRIVAVSWLSQSRAVCLHSIPRVSG
jgi:hypothetical protein